MGKVISIFNQKGGVGKTTTHINLSACLAKKNKKILMIDNDPQGNSTSGIGIQKSKISISLYDVLTDAVEIEQAILDTNIKNLHIIPSSVDLAGAEIELSNIENRETKLKNALKSIKDNYDYVFIDCPPSLGLLSINALVASDSIIVPIQCEFYALEGLGSLINTFNLIKKSLNKELFIQGILLSMYDKRTNLGDEVLKEVNEYFKEIVYKTLIPRNVKLAEAPSFGKPIIDYEPKSTGAKAYKALANEFLKRENNNG